MGLLDRGHKELSRQIRMFCNWEFCDSVYDNKPSMSREDAQALAIMENSVSLKKGHYDIAYPGGKPILNCRITNLWQSIV